MRILAEIECRFTGAGAYTSANCPKTAASKSGKHWTEIQWVRQETPLLVTDISNSGKHNCYHIKVTEDGNVLKLHNNTMIDPYHCVTCNEVDFPKEGDETETHFCHVNDGDRIRF